MRTFRSENSSPMSIRCHCGKAAKHLFIVWMTRSRELKDVSLCHAHSAVLDQIPRTSAYRVLRSSHLQRIA